MGWPAACTIATRSHFAAAAALASSFRQHHPEARFYLLAVDGSPEVPLPAGVVLLRPEELPIANLVEMCFQYGSRELCRALKAALLSHLLRERGERAVFSGQARAEDLESLLGVALSPAEVMDVLTGSATPRLRAYRARWGADLPRRIEATLPDGARLGVAVEDAEAPATAIKPVYGSLTLSINGEMKSVRVVH